jgi:hypothetical protein
MAASSSIDNVAFCANDIPARNIGTENKGRLDSERRNKPGFKRSWLLFYAVKTQDKGASKI